MIGRKIVSLLTLLFVLSSAGFFLYKSVTRPRLLVLHSYDPGYPWVRDVNAGLNRVLTRKNYYSIRWHYMDLKRQTAQEFRRAAELTAERVVREYKPDVIILVDDIAQRLVGKDLVDHPTIRLVFAGVNGNPETYGYDVARNVTGILERKQLGAVKQAVLDLWSEGAFSQSPFPRLVNLGDGSKPLLFDEMNIKAFDWAPIMLADSIQARSFDHWQEIVTGIGDRADLILVSNYRQLPRTEGSGSIMPPEEIMRWTEENSPVPVIGANGFNVEDGGALAVGVSPYEQGQVAATLAAEIIESQVEPRDLPIVTGDQFVVALRGTGLRKRGLQLPAIYEAFARSTNNYRE